MCMTITGDGHVKSCLATNDYAVVEIRVFHVHVLLTSRNSRNDPTDSLFIYSVTGLVIIAAS